MASVDTRASQIAKIQEELNVRLAAFHEKVGRLEETQLNTNNHILALDKKLEENHINTNQSIFALDKKIDSAVEQLSLQFSKDVERFELGNKDKPIMGSAPPVIHHTQRSSFLASPSLNQSHTSLSNIKPTRSKSTEGNSSQYAMNPSSCRLEFPHFDGSNPITWLLKALNCFKMMNISDDDRVIVASNYFEGEALDWFYQVSVGHVELSWDEFVEQISLEFGDIQEAQVLDEFSKLHMMGSLQDYIKRFTKLKSHLLMFQRGNYDELYFVHSFISGLQLEMKQNLWLQAPTTLVQAISLAKIQDNTMEGASKRKLPVKLPVPFNPTPMRRSLSLPNTQTPNQNPIPQTQKPEPTTQPIRKLLSVAEMRARREKGLCYNCDEPYNPGHKCKKTHMYFLSLLKKRRKL